MFNSVIYGVFVQCEIKIFMEYSRNVQLGYLWSIRAMLKRNIYGVFVQRSLGILFRIQSSRNDSKGRLQTMQVNTFNRYKNRTPPECQINKNRYYGFLFGLRDECFGKLSGTDRKL